MKDDEKRKVPLALEFGYKAHLHSLYFDAIQDQQIDTENLPRTLDYVRRELEILNEYNLFFFCVPIPNFQTIETQEHTRECFGELLRVTKAKIHIRYGDPVESAFEVGVLFALNDFGPPQEELVTLFKKRMDEYLDNIGLNTQNLKLIADNLVSEDSKKRAEARQALSKEIKNNFGQGIDVSWLKGFELMAGIPGIAQIKKSWK